MTDFSFIGPTPNPVTDIANFELELQKSSNVRILLSDLSGRIIRTELDEKMELGEHQISLETKDLPTGEYFVTIVTDFGFLSKKLIVF